MPITDDALISATLRFIDSDLAKRAESPLRFVRPIEVFRHRASAVGMESAMPTEAQSPSEWMDAKARRVLAYLKQTTRWIPANPNKSIVKERSAATYECLCRGRPAPDRSDHTVANEQYLDGTFGLDYALRGHSNIIISGLRGVGKTSFLNFWLMTRTADLERTQNRIWFRIDASKVAEIWDAKKRQRPVHEVYWSYYWCHSIYVVLLYGGALPEQEKLDSEIDSKSDAFREIVARLKAFHGRELSDMINLLNIARKKAATKSLDAPEDWSRSVIQTALTELSAKQIARFDEFFSILANESALLGYRQIMLIDGVDNIPWTRRSDFYRKTCDDFGKLLSGIKRRAGIETQFIFAARPETIHQINIDSVGHLVGFNNEGRNGGAFATITIDPPDITKILKRKIDAALNSRGFIAARTQAEADIQDPGYFSSNLAELELHSQRFPKGLLNAVQRQLWRIQKYSQQPPPPPAIKPETPDDILRVLFDNDVRAYLDNAIKVFFVAKAFTQVHTPGAGGDTRMLSYVFLNGRPFFDSERHFRQNGDFRSRANFEDRGSVFPNVFWWATDFTRQRPSVWHGLAGTRILQLAMIMKPPRRTEWVRSALLSGRSAA